MRPRTSHPIEEPLRRALIFPLTLLLLAPARGGHAQPSAQSMTVVVALYEEATKAMDKGNYADACPKLEEVVRIDPGRIGPRIELGNCYAAMGRLASAWARYRIAESAAQRANKAERQKEAHDRAEALEPKLARLTIVVPDAVRALPELEIRHDGLVVGPAQW